MKELADMFDEIQLLTLRLASGGKYSVKIVKIEKKTKVNTEKEPCVNKDEYPDYDPAMVSI